MKVINRSNMNITAKAPGIAPLTIGPQQTYVFKSEDEFKLYKNILLRFAEFVDFDMSQEKKEEDKKPEVKVEEPKKEEKKVEVKKPALKKSEVNKEEIKEEEKK